MKVFMFAVFCCLLLSGAVAKIFPPGIDPLTCPDYPFCHNDPPNPLWRTNQEPNKCHYTNLLCDPLENRVIGKYTNKLDAKSCEESCKGSSACKFYTFTNYFGLPTCHLLSSCTSKKPRCPSPRNCVSGSKECQCQQLEMIPKSGVARWSCEGGLDPYKKSVPVNTKCTVSCPTWPLIDSNPQNKDLTLESKCLPGGTWSTTSAENFNVSLIIQATSYIKWPQPNEADPQCSACTDLGPYLVNPNNEEGAEFTCNGRSSDWFNSPDGFTIKTWDSCNLNCNGVNITKVECLDGKWSVNPKDGFYCFNKPSVKKPTTTQPTTKKPTTQKPKNPDQCSKPYTTLTDSWRKVNYVPDGAKQCNVEHCDHKSRNGFTAGWYRFSGSAGSYLPTAPPKNQNKNARCEVCQTNRSAWIQEGRNPVPEDGVMDLTINWYYRGNEKARSGVKGQAVACRDSNDKIFYIYNLPQVSSCWDAYCAI